MAVREPERRRESVVDQLRNPSPNKSLINPNRETITGKASPGNSNNNNNNDNINFPTPRLSGLTGSPKQNPSSSALATVAARLAGNNPAGQNNINYSNNSNIYTSSNNNGSNYNYNYSNYNGSNNASSPRQSTNSPSNARPLYPHYSHEATNGGQTSSPGTSGKKSLLVGMQRKLGASGNNPNQGTREETLRGNTIFPGTNKGLQSNNPMGFLASYPGAYACSSGGNAATNAITNTYGNNQGHYSVDEDDRSSGSTKQHLPAVPESGNLFHTDRDGKRILLRRASVPDLVNSIKYEMLAVGLMLRFKSAVAVTTKGPLLERPTSVIERPSVSSTAGGAAVDEANPKNALSAMFAKRSAPPAATALASVPLPLTASAKSKKESPTPPPLPTC